MRSVSGILQNQGTGGPARHNGVDAEGSQLARTFELPGAETPLGGSLTDGREIAAMTAETPIRLFLRDHLQD